MEKQFKFKKEWFDLLNQCNPQLRSDVIEAVFQYFFNGIEPAFTDEARILAFGFIRAEIDASRARRKARKKEPENVQMPTVTQTEPEPEKPRANSQEQIFLRCIVEHWNNLLRPLKCAELNTDEMLHSDAIIPVLIALRKHGHISVNQRITSRFKAHGFKLPAPDFDSFFKDLLIREA